ncbi:MAG: hypothetical protein ACTSRG_24000, partial [Candidatus Helarchaeota archaeon]
MIPLMFLMLFSAGFSVSLQFDDLTNEVITEYNQKDDFTKFFYNINPLDNSQTVAGSNLTFDKKIELFDVTDNIYLIYTNTELNQTINIGVFNSETGLVAQELTLQEMGDYYFKVISSFDGEDFSILLDSMGTTPSVLYLESEKESEFLGLFTPLVEGTRDLLTLNITIIKTLF